MILSSLAPFIALISYIGAFAYLFSHLIRQSRFSPMSFSLMSFVALAAHSFILYNTMITSFGIHYDVFSLISFTSALMFLISLCFSYYRPILALNLLGIPVAVIGLILGLVFPIELKNIQPNHLSVDIHIILSLSAYAILLMATIQAILLWLQNRELKKKSKRLWVHLLPSVQAMENLLFDLILTGFIFLSVALVWGMYSIEDLFAQHLAHKTFFSILSWLIYSALLLGHYIQGWRGQKAIRFTLCGFGLLALGFIGSKFVLNILLNR